MLPPTNYTVYVINAHRHSLEHLSQDCVSMVFVALMVAVSYDGLPPHTVLTHWLSLVEFYNRRL